MHLAGARTRQIPRAAVVLVVVTIDLMTIRRRVAELISNAQEREHHTFVSAAYRGCLRREPDSGGLDMYVDLLESGKMQWADVLTAIIASPEFRTVYTRSESMNSLHQGRMLLFR